ncbi:hypothetical protein MNBD_DELTA04-1567 [hydrothermal vent metagenome]|uniref:Uncharacterized protein n=1 Tax=hydrothermal vent metagenome TaxID=652676 RepID=A0A3B0VNP9_9ZZZZ
MLNLSHGICCIHSMGQPAPYQNTTAAYYHPRSHRDSPRYRLLLAHFDHFEQVYDERLAGTMDFIVRSCLNMATRKRDSSVSAARTATMSSCSPFPAGVCYKNKVARDVMPLYMFSLRPTNGQQACLFQHQDHGPFAVPAKIEVVGRGIRNMKAALRPTPPAGDLNLNPLQILKS